jgi:hypothetical protein
MTATRTAFFRFNVAHAITAGTNTGPDPDTGPRRKPHQLRLAALCHTNDSRTLQEFVAARDDTKR